MLANSLIDLDRAHLIHPVSSWRGQEAAGVRLLTHAQGATVRDAEGRELLDGFAGLWCVNAGYGQPSVIEAATRQMQDLCYATGYFGLGSEPAVRLAARLAEAAPGDLDHVCFTLCGSDAIDSTVRFVRYYWHARGMPTKQHIISVAQGYHGSSAAGAGPEGLRDHPLVGDVRGRGMLAAIKLVTDKRRKTPLPAAADPATRIFDRAWDQVLVLRAFGWGVLGYAPPLCSTADGIDQIVARTRKVLDLTLDDPDLRREMV